MSSNPAWQGAAKVARARLQTIDTALAKLETAVPNIENQTPQPDNPIPNANNTPTEPTVPPANQIETELKHANDPTPIPAPSIQALETFLGGTV